MKDVWNFRRKTKVGAGQILHHEFRHALKIAFPWKRSQVVIFIYLLFLPTHKGQLSFRDGDGYHYFNFINFQKWSIYNYGTYLCNNLGIVGTVIDKILFSLSTFKYLLKIWNISSVINKILLTLIFTCSSNLNTIYYKSIALTNESTINRNTSRTVQY